MADARGRAGGSKPLHLVDGVLRDEAPPKSERRAIVRMEGPRPDGRCVVSYGPARSRPPFPKRPLNPASVEPADLSEADKAEIVRLVRLVQTDFDPERDPRGWDSVAVLVRGVGYGDEEIRKMDYLQLQAVFRTSAAQMRLQKTGSISCGIATSTSTIVRLGDAADQPPPAQGSKVLRVGTRGHTTRAIDVDGPLGRLETKMRKQLAAETGSDSAAAAALVEKLYSLSSADLEPMLRKVGCTADARTIRRNSEKYKAWERYRRPAAAPPAAVDVGPAALSDVRPRAADVADDAVDSGNLSRRTGGRGTTRIGKTAAEKAAEDAADRLAREAGIDLPPAE